MTVTTGSSTVFMKDAGPGSALHVELADVPTRNALSPKTVDVLHMAVARAIEESRPALVLKSTGPVFASGADLRDLSDADDEALRVRFRSIHELLTAIQEAPLLSIAIVDGPAIGAGADLALACDHRIGSPLARFRFPGPQFGLLLGTRRLARETSPATAQHLALTSATLSAEQALETGILTRLVDASQLESAAEELTTGAQSAPVDIATLVGAVRNRAHRDADIELLEESMTPGLAQRMRAFRNQAGGHTR